MIITAVGSDDVICINRLNPTGHVMHQQFNIQQLYVLPTLLYLSEKNSDLCH